MCPRCHSKLREFVHGHVQCGTCWLILEPCCEGVMHQKKSQQNTTDSTENKFKSVGIST